MINLGYGSSIVVRRLSPETVILSIHLQAGFDLKSHPLFNGATTDIYILIGNDAFKNLRDEINGIDDNELQLNLSTST